MKPVTMKLSYFRIILVFRIHILNSAKWPQFKHIKVTLKYIKVNSRLFYIFNFRYLK